MRALIVLLALASGLGCGHAAKVRPTPKGQLDARTTLGGPLGQVTSTITVPLPLSTVGASYGVTDRMDVSAHAHPTALAFGVAGLDLGASYLLHGDEGPGPALTVLGRLYGFVDVRKGSAVAYGELGVTPSYRFTPWLTGYAALNALLQVGRSPLVPAVALGAEGRFGRFAVQLEGRWYAPHYPTQTTAVDWISIAGLGAWGPVASLSYRFGGDP